MKARETGGKRPCVHCGEPTMFVRTFSRPIVGKRKRGGVMGLEDCCTDCGEHPARRKKEAA